MFGFDNVNEHEVAAMLTVRKVKRCFILDFVDKRRFLQTAELFLCFCYYRTSLIFHSIQT